MTAPTFIPNTFMAYAPCLAPLSFDGLTTPHFPNNTGSYGPASCILTSYHTYIPTKSIGIEPLNPITKWPFINHTHHTTYSHLLYRIEQNSISCLPGGDVLQSFTSSPHKYVMILSIPQTTMESMSHLLMKRFNCKKWDSQAWSTAYPLIPFVFARTILAIPPTIMQRYSLPRRWWKLYDPNHKTDKNYIWC